MKEEMKRRRSSLLTQLVTKAAGSSPLLCVSYWFFFFFFFKNDLFIYLFTIIFCRLANDSPCRLRKDAARISKNAALVELMTHRGAKDVKFVIP